MIMPLIRNSIIIMPDNTKSSQHSRMQDLTITNFYPNEKDRPSVAGRHDRDLLWRKSMGCSDIVTWDF